jgi:uncharacterized protein YdeI (YjbR/CyaY-like superfamily)
MNTLNPKVDEYLGTLPKWQEELEALRMMVLDCGLTEELKWGVPCYMFQQSNLILLGAFKDYCVLSFIKGALLSDTDGILIQQTENSHSGRIIKFSSVREIIKMKPLLKAYIYEAIEVEKAGLKVEYKKLTDFDIPEELQKIFEGDPVFKTAFEALTSGRQKGYFLYFSEPKQSKTRTERVEKYRQRILDGKGIRDCICGLSKKLPSCDGSHKYI